MKLFFVLIGLTLGTCAFSESQREMNQDACRASEKNKKEMNRTFQKVLNKITKSKNRVALREMKKSQKAWEAFSQAHMAAVFPDDGEYQGSVAPMCSCNEFAVITSARTKQLKRWLLTVEGDVCTL